MNRCITKSLSNKTEILDINVKKTDTPIAPFFTKPNEYFQKNDHFNHWLKKCKQFINLVHLKKNAGARYKIEHFSYEEKLATYELPEEGVSSEILMESLADIVDGSIQCHSQNAVYNMVPSPLLESQAAASMMQLYNINAIMDTYGGQSLLYEQKIARSIGKLINWPQANGLSCNGGKITIFYALKQAIERIAPESHKKGVPKDLVILTSEKAHYSIEHCCNLVGLGSDQCIRIPTFDSQSLPSQSLITAFEKQLQTGKRIAAIICCGGTTIDFICDDTTTIALTCEKLVKQYQLNYKPYLHFDSVIGWLWFPFINNQNLLDKTSKIIQTKIQSVITHMASLNLFDSIGADFHKNGLCPYSSSFFISKHLPITYEVNNEGHVKSKVFGEVNAFNYTLENSRPATGIASAWASLNRLGLNGLKQYLIHLMENSEEIKSYLKQYSGLEILNDPSRGWEIIFKPKPLDILIERYSTQVLIQDFYRYINQLTFHGTNTPSISIIKNYRNNSSDSFGVGLIWYPMSVTQTQQQRQQQVKHFMNVFDQYQQSIVKGNWAVSLEAVTSPIR